MSHSRILPSSMDQFIPSITKASQFIGSPRGKTASLKCVTLKPLDISFDSISSPTSSTQPIECGVSMAGAHFECSVVNTQPSSFTNPVMIKHAQVAFSQRNDLACKKNKRKDRNKRGGKIALMTCPKEKRKTCLVCFLAPQSNFIGQMV